jgi:hypothetical protein
MYYKSRLETDPLRVWEKFFDTPISDRTGILANDRDIITPIPDVASTDTFSNLVDAKATDILSQGKKIKVMYSGGLDSTLVLCSLYKNKTENSPEIEVLLTQNSINENPNFFENYITNYRKYEGEMDGSSYSKFMVNNDDDFIIVTGEIGDQLFGSSLILNDLDHASQPVDWEKYSGLNALCAVCPMPVLTNADLLWWVNFTLKYQWVQLRIYKNMAIDFNKYVHFFDTTEFQRWSMQTSMTEKIPDFSPTKYKQDIRGYILDFTGDRDYCQNKTKVPSLKSIYHSGGYVCTGIDSSFNRIWHEFILRTHNKVDENGTQKLKAEIINI